jgi:L-rhamnose mutarotase
MRHRILPILLATAAVTMPVLSAASPRAGKEKIAKLQKEFLNLKFGMFLHYNMATYTNEEWVVGYPDPSPFNPGGRIDTDQWADVAKAAGMKYAILTAKHVSGFCLWDSKYTTYDVMHPDLARRASASILPSKHPTSSPETNSSATMIRKAFVMSVHPGCESEYEKRHNPIWEELAAVLRDHGVHNYSIHLHTETGQLFAYAEIESEERWQAIAETAVCKKWWKHLADLMPANPDSSPLSIPLREVFHLP